MPSVLLMVDLLTDFLPGGRRPVPLGEEVVRLANRLSPHFPLMAAAITSEATKDAAIKGAADRAADAPARETAVCMTEPSFPGELDRARLAQVVRISPATTAGGETSADARMHRDDETLSGASELESWLHEEGIDELYIMGLGTERGVKATALAARSLGFRTFLIEDGCRALDTQPGDGERALAAMAEAGVQFVESQWLATPVERLCESKYLRLLKRGPWEYVQRTHPAGAVVIVAVTDDDRVVLTDQWRVPVGRRVIEMPAGIVGDEPDQADEPRLEAARRELLEETGYEADEWCEALTSVSSAGLTDETVTFFLARGLRRVAAGGGIAHEKILVHLVPLSEFDLWLDQRLAAGYQVDGRLYSGIWLWRRWAERSS